MKTRAAVLYEPKTPFVIESLDLAPPKSGEVLIRMAAVGVCRSDWHLVVGDTKHPLPVVAGHEGAGVVEQLGPGVTELKIGDHVTLNWAPACRDCFYCRAGRPNLCETWLEPIWRGTLLDGTARLSMNGRPVYHFCGLAAFSERSVVPVACCVKTDPKVPLTIAALIGCAVATGVGAVLNTAEVRPDASVAVFGAGGVGLSVLLAAQMVGARQIIAVDQSAAKRDLVGRFGATDFVEAGPDAVAGVRELTDGRGADYVFEAVGDPRVQEQALAAARPGGKIVLAGLSPMGSQTNLPGAVITRQEKAILGSYYGTTDAARDFPLYADYYLRGKLDLDRLVSRTYDLAQINEAYAEMQRGSAARGVIVFT